MEVSCIELTGWTEVLPGSRGAGPGATSLLNRKGASLELLALQTLFSSISLIRGDHLDEAEASGLLGVGVAHDLALLDGSVLSEQTGDLILGQAGVDAGDEEVGARVDSAVIVAVATAVATAVVTAVAGLLLNGSAAKSIG